MSIGSTVNLSEVAKHGRIDADFYKEEYLLIETQLSKLKVKKLSSLATEIKCGPFGSTILSETYIPNGIPLIRPFNLQYMRIDGEIVYIPDEDVTSKNLKLYKNEDVFFSRVGDIKIGLVYGFDDNVTISPNIIAVSTNKQKINPYYLIVFLNTKYGFKQLERGLKIVAQPTIDTSAVKELMVPILDDNLQLDIEKAAKKAFNLYDDSKNLYLKAEKLLLENLKIKEFMIEHNQHYKSDLKQVKNANRMDAEYFQPAYDQIIDDIKSNDFGRLGNYFEIINGKNFSYLNDGDIGVIKTKQVSKSLINYEVESYTSSEISGKKNLVSLEDRDIVFASMGVGSLGKTGIYYEFEEPESNFTIDSTIKVFRENVTGISPEMLCVFMNSWVGQELIYKYVVGSSGIISIYDKDIKNLVVPKLEEDVQLKITSFLSKSHESRKIARDLLEQSKRKVESVIENKFKE